MRDNLVNVVHSALAKEFGAAHSIDQPTSIPIEQVIAHRISLPVLRARVELGLSAEEQSRLEQDVASHLIAASKLVPATAVVSSALHSAGVTHVVVKGAALGALQGGLTQRGAGDVDLLVEPSDIPATHNVLGELGYRPAVQTPPVTNHTSWKILTTIDRETTYVGREVDVDLHWRVSPQRHLFPPARELASRAVKVDLGGVAVPTASPADALAMAAFHYYYDRFALMRGVFDVHRLLPLVSGSSLTDFSPKLGALVSGVLTLSLELFPGVNSDKITTLLGGLPPPLPMVRQVWDQYGGHHTSLRPERNATALWQMFQAERAFDSGWEALPRYLGKRLFYYPPATDNEPHQSLAKAFGRQMVRVLNGTAS